LCRRYLGGQLVFDMARDPRRDKTVHVPFFRDLFAAPPTAGGYA
jgi:hypothetical protein